MLQQTKARQNQSAARLRKYENDKALALNVSGGRVFKTWERQRPRPPLHLYASNKLNTAGSCGSSGSSSGGGKSAYQQGPVTAPHHDLQMTPLTVPLLPHVPPRPILTQRTPPPLRSSRVYSGRRPSPGRPYAHAHGQAQIAAQIQLLRPNNTPVSVEKVDLDRRGLTSWPVVGSGEEPVRLLSLQHNLLTRVDPPSPSPSLLLLDLYHNHLHNLHGLHAFPNLRVLMLAKNRLSRLDGLEQLSRLEVLDLHGNQLHHLQGLAHLKELRLLNLAGNMLRHVTGLRGLDCLVELNLRRNLIRTVADLHYLPRLEKVFMGYNEIYRYEDIACLQNCLKLRELSLEENPVSRQPHYFHHAVTRFYRLKRLDDQELTMETRRQSEKQLQKARDKERAQATRISDEEKRNSAITNAMKHWQVVKKDHKKLIRKPSESSTSTLDQPPSKDSDATELSSGFCGDTVSDAGELEVTVTDENGEEGKVDEEEAAPGQQEDDRASLVSSVTSSGISDISLVHKGTDQRLSATDVLPAQENVTVNAVNNSIQAIKQFKMNSPRNVDNKNNFPRSKSYTDMRILRRKNSFEGDRTLRPKSVRDSNSEGLGGSGKVSEKISLDTASRATIPVKNVPVVRRGGTRQGSAQNRAVDKSRPRIIANENVKSANAKNLDFLKKTEQLKEAGRLPDKIVTAAITRVRSNLSLPIQGPEPPVSPRNAVSEPSEVDSSSDAESANTSTTTNTTATLTGSAEINSQSAPATTHHNLADLRVPLSRPKDPERPACEKGDKPVPSINQNTSGILREQGPNFLAELEGERLSLYGQGALRCTDISWDKSVAAAATTARFQYMNFEDIVDIFPKLRVKFPRLENFMFVETHLAKCSQLNALAELHQVTSLEVGREGNPLTQTPYWRLYAIFRLSHWGLRVINGLEVSEEERTEAAVMFSPLSQLAFTCLPRDQLAAFLSSHHHHANDQGISSPRTGSGGHDPGSSREEPEAPRLNVPHLQELIGKEALQYRPVGRLTQDESSSLVCAGRQARQLVVWTYDSLHRLNIHQSTWPSVLHDLVRDAVTDLAKPTYGKQCLEDVKRSLGWKK
ncbi:leucine-rich repeat-containing protein 49 [Procambarus clarkii]|uniref:leucine-rich repeat-containing protein 49 n=1 Tax=Procambarus clarkii TaxID=6728 RepID=UPI001E678D90|nr:leucine-rich repeat-containing protein 49-like [Procambarus clarkii]